MAAAFSLCTTLADRIQAMLERQVHSDAINFVAGCVEEEIRDLSTRLHDFGGELVVADGRLFDSESAQRWLNSVDQVVYEIEDVLDEWDLAIRNLLTVPSQSRPELQVCSSETPVTPPDIAHKIKLVSSKLGPLLKEFEFPNATTAHRRPYERRLPSTSLANVDEIHGRHLEREVLLRRILPEGDREVKSGVRLFFIVGLGGIGKTTLAQLLFNDSKIRDFYPFRIWICLNSFDEVGVAKEIIEKVSGCVPNTSDWDSLVVHLRDSLRGKKCFLVLDDVGMRTFKTYRLLCENLRNCGEEITIFMTTKNTKLVSLQKHDYGMRGGRNRLALKPLSDESCWSILCDTALSGRSFDQVARFKDVGMEIAKKCKGIPHTAKVLGRYLRSKCSVEEWKSVLATQFWELKGKVRDDIFGPLVLTYHDLPTYIRHCFSYFGLIPKGSEVYVNKLLWCWSALGYLHGKNLERKGLRYLEELMFNSVFEELVRDEFHHVIMCKMHDIVHDYAQYLRKNATSSKIGASCQNCSTSLVSCVEEYHSLFFQQDSLTLTHICDCLKSLRVLSLRDCSLKRIPKNMTILIHLKFLDLSYNEELCHEDLKTICNLYLLETLFLSSCELEEIPTEIGNLFQLRYLDLSFNSCLMELPESICNLLELRILNLNECHSLSKLPEGIHNLRNLTYIHNLFTKYVCPKGFERLTSLCTLNEFSGDLSLLRDLNLLGGILQLRIPESYCLDDVAKAKEAKMCDKKNLVELEILFPSDFSILGEDTDDTVSMDILDALCPHSYLRYLQIELYGGSNLPGWMVSPFNNVAKIELKQCSHLSYLPPLGRLPWLEELTLLEMDGLLHVGREFLGLKSETGDGDDASSSWSWAAINAFRTLKALIFYKCPNWEEWVDITAEELTSADVQIMPQLKNLDVVACRGLAVLPHCLLRKAVALEELDIYDSGQLVEAYADKEGSYWNSISHIPQVRFD